MSRRRAEVTARFSQFALASSDMAVKDAGLDLTLVPADRLTVAFGTSMSGLVDFGFGAHESFLGGQGIQPWIAREFPGQAATTHVGSEVGARGPTTTMASACAAGLDAIAWAAERVCRGEATAAIAGASETPLGPSTLEAFREFGLLATWAGDPASACRPFELNRTGLVVSEGAAAVVLEEERAARARGAHIYARVLGSGRSMEAPARRIDLEGKAAAQSMTEALRAAGFTPRDVDYIAAHGNGIPDHDLAETSALKLALGPQAWSVPVSSIRSMCGQAMAASSAIQIVTGCLVIRDRQIPPTINFHERDPQCDLDYVPNKARVARVRNVLVHVRSIGGTHASMILGHPG